MDNRPRGASEIFGTVPFGLKRHVSPHGQVTAVSMMKDEGPFVIEWVAHHLAVGFTDLVVFTNDCSDGTDDMLIRLEELGLAHHRRNVIPEGVRPQPSALSHAEQDDVVCQSDWVLVFDADEFLSIRHGDGTLDDLIGAAVAQDANGIVVTWRIFGSGGVVDWSRAPVSEQYLMAAPPDWNKGWGVKTLFKFDPEYWKLGIHRPKIKTKHIKSGFPDEVRWLNGSGREMPEYFKFRGWRSIYRTIGYDWVQLNHYAVKSVDSYALRKLRGNVNNKADKYNSDYWSLQDRNEVRDETMLRYTERRNAVIAALLEDPVLSRLHHAAVERAEARLDEIRRTPAYAELVEGLAKASAVPLGQIVAKPPQARDKEKIAALMSDVEKLRTSKAREERLGQPDPSEMDRPPPTRFAVPPIRIDGAHPGDWVENHGIELPLDARIFSATALPGVGKGKFDRGLARKLPAGLPKAGRFVDIGSGIGFVGLHLSRIRPDLTVMLQEDDPGLVAARQMVFERNGAAFGPGLVRIPDSLGAEAEGLPALVERLAPDVLMLGDARITTAVLGRILSGPAVPGQIYLHGRLIEDRRDELPAFADVFETAGFAPIPRFDAAVVMARRRARAG